MTKNETETALRTIFRNMDAHEAQEIREAYYKAVEGLRTLADALEIADTKAVCAFKIVTPLLVDLFPQTRCECPL